MCECTWAVYISMHAEICVDSVGAIRLRGEFDSHISMSYHTNSKGQGMDANVCECV